MKNLGPGVSSGFSVKDVLPDGFTYKSASFPSSATDADGQTVSGNAGACTYDKTNRTITCVPEVGATGIAAGQSRVMEITATAPDMDHLMYDGGEKDICFHNTATVDGNETDPNKDNNSSSTAEVCIARSMNVSKTADSKYVPGLIKTASIPQRGR